MAMTPRIQVYFKSGANQYYFYMQFLVVVA